MKIREISISAAIAALITVVTMVVSLPLGNIGYFNLGDVIILLAAYYLSPGLLFLSAGIGSALADILLSYYQYAGFTFIIKGLQGATVAWLLRKDISNYAIKFAGGLVIMVLGYALTDVFLFASYEMFSFSILLNGQQAIVAWILAIALFQLVRKQKPRSENGY